MNKYIKEICELVNIERILFYSFRYVCFDLLILVEVDLIYIKI